MMRRRAGVAKFIREEDGQVLPMMTATLVLLCSLAGLVIDGGRAYGAWRALQAATDAEALAAAQTMTLANFPSDVYAAATLYSATVGNKNASPELTNVTAPQPVLECLNMLIAQNQYCVGPVPYNAVQVTQTMVLNTTFARLFGWKTLTISARSTASAHGGVPRFANIAVVLDTTLSMGLTDTNCGNVSQMVCALDGVETLLLNIAPCPVIDGICQPGSIPGNVKDSIQRIGLFAFPAVSVDTVSIDTSCTTAVPAPTKQNGYWGPIAGATDANFVMPRNPGNSMNVSPFSGIPTGVAYAFPAYNATTYLPGSTAGSPTYQITSFLSDYRRSATSATLNTASDMVQSTGGASGCGGILTANYAGVYGTYYAGAIYAAQSALTAQQQLYPGSTNVIIFLSDGDANAPQNNGSYSVMPGANSTGSYPSYQGECSQAIDAAGYATGNGTEVYTVAYGSPTTGCSTDSSAGTHKGVTPCQTMATMATNTHYFYSDFNQSGTVSNCTTSYPSVSLNDIFKTIAIDLTVARLVPNSWT